ncbi:MAG: hypothetical protein ACYCS1_05415 [Gammaproteobacteria bacterium]
MPIENEIKQFSDLLIRDDKIYWEFKKAFLNAVKKKHKQFKFMKADVLTIYAYYNIQYVEAERHIMGLKLIPRGKKLNIQYKEMKWASVEL